ncbi:MAG TPA: hypothetical protein VFI05_10120 [Nitrospiraceae bacterium]|nr:hypothetical protein [Nitrospiraceae bacterium]
MKNSYQSETIRAWATKALALHAIKKWTAVLSGSSVRNDVSCEEAKSIRQQIAATS